MLLSDDRVEVVAKEDLKRLERRYLQHINYLEHGEVLYNLHELFSALKKTPFLLDDHYHKGRVLPLGMHIAELIWKKYKNRSHELKELMTNELFKFKQDDELNPFGNLEDKLRLALEAPFTEQSLSLFKKFLFAAVERGNYHGAAFLSYWLLGFDDFFRLRNTPYENAIKWACEKVKHAGCLKRLGIEVDLKQTNFWIQSNYSHTRLERKFDTEILDIYPEIDSATTFIVDSNSQVSKFSEGKLVSSRLLPKFDSDLHKINEARFLGGSKYLIVSYSIPYKLDSLSTLRLFVRSAQGWQLARSFDGHLVKLLGIEKATKYKWPHFFVERNKRVSLVCIEKNFKDDDLISEYLVKIEENFDSVAILQSENPDYLVLESRTSLSKLEAEKFRKSKLLSPPMKKYKSYLFDLKTKSLNLLKEYVGSEVLKTAFTDEEISYDIQGENSDMVVLEDNNYHFLKLGKPCKKNYFSVHKNIDHTILTNVNLASGSKTHYTLPLNFGNLRSYSKDIISYSLGRRNFIAKLGTDSLINIASYAIPLRGAGVKLNSIFAKGRLLVIQGNDTKYVKVVEIDHSQLPTKSYLSKFQLRDFIKELSDKTH